MSGLLGADQFDHESPATERPDRDSKQGERECCNDADTRWGW
jgi:hypothetical protein